MRSAMDEATFLKFYSNTLKGFSKGVQSNICRMLEEEKRIIFDNQISLETPNALLFDVSDRKNFSEIINRTASNKEFCNFYERWEFTKLYKYSVPFFFTSEGSIDIKDSLEQEHINEFIYDKFTPIYIIDTDFEDITPLFTAISDGIFIIKFIFQKSYPDQETEEFIDYRFPVLIYINSKNSFLEIRYDNVMTNPSEKNDKFYEAIVFNCIKWLKKVLHFNLFLCDHSNTIDVVKDAANKEVVVYKQMMQMDTGGAAELTASKQTDYILPFTDEIRELMNDNYELFDAAPKIKELISDYLSEKESTASYPYIYAKWIQPVESRSYMVKIIFDYFEHQYTLLQHITGNCRDFGMERMNNAIEYLCQRKAFIRGKEIYC